MLNCVICGKEIIGRGGRYCTRCAAKGGGERIKAVNDDKQRKL